MTALAPTLEAFFTDRLCPARASPHTVASYRDTFSCCSLRPPAAGKCPSILDFADLDAPRSGPSSTTWNTNGGTACHPQRPAGRHPLAVSLRSVALPGTRRAHRPCPRHPPKRLDPIVCFLSRAEVDALLAAPNQTSLLGSRDHALLLTAVQTGLRVAELTGLAAPTPSSVPAPTSAASARAERSAPPADQAHRPEYCATGCRAHAAPATPLFPNRAGGQLSSRRRRRLARQARRDRGPRCPSLTGKIITPHTLRHTCAMNLLQSGIDSPTIALWLGHATPKATTVYLHADLALKEQALARTAPPTVSRRRYQPPDALLTFLDPVVMPTLPTTPPPLTTQNSRTRDPTRHNSTPGMIAVMPGPA